jgi:hypothetical protein
LATGDPDNKKGRGCSMVKRIYATSLVVSFFYDVAT